MIRSFHRKFMYCKWRHLPMFQDEGFTLVPKRYCCVPYSLEDCQVYVFHICSGGQSIGEIAARVGEGDALFYLGHIGYHIDPPFRGRHGAAHACEMIKPLFRQYGMRTIVITTDVDNFPSIKTCERIGCEWESTVDVPVWCQEAYEISSRKKRFIFSL